jgi:hypothetical protein
VSNIFDSGLNKFLEAPSFLERKFMNDQDQTDEDVAVDNAIHLLQNLPAHKKVGAVHKLTATLENIDPATVSVKPHWYPPQDDTWKKIFSTFKTSGFQFHRAILSAQMQAGKTGVMTAGTIDFSNYFKKKKEEFLVLNVLAAADNGVRDQNKDKTEKVIKDYDLDIMNYEFIHRAAIETCKKRIRETEATKVLIFVDEAHLAARDGQSINELKKTAKHWVSQNEDRRVLWIDVSATGFTHTACDYFGTGDINGGLFFLPVDEAYNSIKHMLETKRIKPNGKLFHGALCTTFGSQIFTEINKRFNKGLGYYAILRVTGDAEKVIRTNYGHDYDVWKADSKGSKRGDKTHFTIAEIPGRLSQKVSRPTIILIKGALRVGVELVPEVCKNILLMVDGSSMQRKADTDAQSLLGRACGYNKKNDTFPIYVNMKHIEILVRHFDGEEGVFPEGMNSKEFDAALEGYTDRVYNPLYDVVDYIEAPEPNDGVSKISLGNVYDYGKLLLEGKMPRSRGADDAGASKGYRGILVDKPNLKGKWTESWSKLEGSKFKVGKFYQAVLTARPIDDIVEKVIHPKFNGLVEPKTA